MELQFNHAESVEFSGKARFALGLLLLMCSLSLGCTQLGRTAAITEQVLVDRTGQPVPGLPDYRHEENASQQLDKAIHQGFAELSKEAVSQSKVSQSKVADRSFESDAATNLQSADAQQLLSEMLQRTDDPFFQERLLELRKQAAAIPSSNLPRQEVPNSITDRANVVTATPAVNRLGASGNNRLGDNSALRNTGALGEDGIEAGNRNAISAKHFTQQPELSQVSYTSSERHNDAAVPRTTVARTQSLRDIQLPANQDFQAQLHPENQVDPGTQSPVNQQSMQVEVVTSDASEERVSSETLALREQLKQATELNRQMLAATAAMMPNAMLSGSGRSGSGSSGLSGLDAAMVGGQMVGGQLSGLDQLSMGTSDFGGGNSSLSNPNAALTKLLMENARQSLSQTNSSLDSAGEIPPFDLTSNRPIGSAVNAVANTNGSAPVIPLSASKSIEPGKWKEDLTGTIQALRENLPHVADSSERQTLEVYLRLMELISSNHDAAVRTIDSLPPEMQDFWRHQIFALSQITRQPDDQQDALFVNNTRRATKTLSHLRDAVDALESVAQLQITNMTFCQEVRSFGDYDLAQTTTVEAGDPLLVYCEVENYSTRKMSGTSGDRYSAKLAPEYALYNDQHALVHQQKYPTVVDECKSQRQDFFITLQLQVPENLPPGRYHLVVTVEDLEGNKVSTGSPLPFYIR